MYMTYYMKMWLDYFNLNDTDKLMYLLNCKMRVILNSVGKFIYGNILYIMTLYESCVNFFII